MSPFVRQAQTRSPAGWIHVAVAALLTWISVSGFAWLLIAIGAVMPGTETLFSAENRVFEIIVAFLSITTFTLMFAFVVSWAPLVIMIPIVRWMVYNNLDTCLTGAIFGIVAGGVTGFTLFDGTAIILGAYVGAIFGMTNLFILYLIRDPSPP